jgi:hypothetical protein
MQQKESRRLKRYFQIEPERFPLFLSYLTDAGLSLSSVASLFRISVPAVRYHLRKLRICARRTRCRPISRLRCTERKALRQLLSFIPADVVSEWLGVQFGTLSNSSRKEKDRCSTSSKTS